MGLTLVVPTLGIFHLALIAICSYAMWLQIPKSRKQLILTSLALCTVGILSMFASGSGWVYWCGLLAYLLGSLIDIANSVRHQTWRRGYLFKRLQDRQKLKQISATNYPSSK